MKKLTKKVVSTILIVAMAMSVGMPAFANDENVKPYESVKYYKTEEAITQLRSENDKVNNLLMAIESTEQNLKLIGVQVKEVYVLETKDEQGEIVESRVLNELEVQKLENTPELAISWIDGAGKDLEKLSFTLAAYDDEEYYRLYGSAGWTGYSALGDGEENPAKNNDFIAITWGGDNTLKCPTNGKSIYGIYSDDTNIAFNSSKADSYKGMCWEFSELKNNKYAEDIHVNITLEKAANPQNLETAANLIYVHTFKEAAISITGFVEIQEIPVPIISCSASNVYWEDSVAISGLIY